MTAQDRQAFTVDGNPARIRFDRDNPARVIDWDTAEEILMAWRKRNPAQFGYWLAAAQMGVEPSKTAKNPKPAGEGV